MSGSITATAGFFLDDTVTPQTITDLNTAVAAASGNISQAAASATASAASAVASAASATQSASSAATATAAIPSATAAAASATNSLTYATNSATSATASAASAAAASTSQAAAAASAAAASTSATAAATSSSAAGSQAALATSQANSASSSAGAASTSAALAATIAQQVAANSVGRNRLFNGRLNVQQRGTGGFINGSVTADLWRLSTNTTGMSCALFAVGGFGPGVTQVLSCTGVAATGQVIDYLQRCLSSDIVDLSGQTVTVSFYCSAATTSGTVSGLIYLQQTATLNNWASPTTIAQVVITPTSTATRYTATFTGLPSLANGLQVGFRVSQAAGAGTLTHNASGFQLEVAPSASTLDLVPLADDMSRCLRSYYQTPFQHYGYTTASCTNSYSSPFPQPMRATPVVTLTGVASSNVTSPTVTAASAVNYAITSVGVATGGFQFTGTAAFSAEV